jgi:hypothetical protein
MNDLSTNWQALFSGRNLLSEKFSIFLFELPRRDFQTKALAAVVDARVQELKEENF